MCRKGNEYYNITSDRDGDWIQHEARRLETGPCDSLQAYIVSPKRGAFLANVPLDPVA